MTENVRIVLELNSDDRLRNHLSIIIILKYAFQRIQCRVIYIGECEGGIVANDSINRTSTVGGNHTAFP